MNNFYVYMYMDQDNAPFYVGKGNGNRFHVSGHLFNNQPFLKRKIKKVGVDNIKVHFLHENLAETMAFQFETFYIGFYGRRDLGKGTLCNLTDGGEGSSGCIPSKETRQKMSKARIGKYQGENSPMYGKHLSEETRQKMSEAHKGNQNAKGFTHSEEAKKKMSENMKGNQRAKGFVHSEETRKKVSEAMKGENHPMYGKHHSEESKKKISESKRVVKERKVQE